MNDLFIAPEGSELKASLDRYDYIEKTISKEKEKNNYKVQLDIKCCHTCNKADFGWEGEIYCLLYQSLEGLAHYKTDTHKLGICDKYEA